MTTYADRLQNLVTYQNNIKNALIEKGATVANNATFKDFASAVGTITGGGGEDDPFKDETVISLNGYIKYDDETRYDLTYTITSETFSMQRDYLTGIRLSQCKTIETSAFCYCRVLEKAYFPNCKDIYGYAFYGCSMLRETSFPECSNIQYQQAFGFCTKLSEVYFPKLTRLGQATFWNCSSLTKVSLPMCKYIHASAFYRCSALSTISLPNALNFESYAFYNAEGLHSLYLLGSAVPTLERSNAFAGCPLSMTYTGSIVASIFVRASLLDLFKTSTNWVYVSDRFVGLTDEEIAGLEE